MNRVTFLVMRSLFFWLNIQSSIQFTIYQDVHVYFSIILHRTLLPFSYHNTEMHLCAGNILRGLFWCIQGLTDIWVVTFHSCQNMFTYNLSSGFDSLTSCHWYSAFNGGSCYLSEIRVFLNAPLDNNLCKVSARWPLQKWSEKLHSLKVCECEFRSILGCSRCGSPRLPARYWPLAYLYLFDGWLYDTILVRSVTEGRAARVWDLSLGTYVRKRCVRTSLINPGGGGGPERSTGPELRHQEIPTAFVPRVVFLS